MNSPNKLVCVDHENRFYVPVGSIVCILQKEETEQEVIDAHKGNKDYVSIFYNTPDGVKEYKRHLANYEVDSYCKSLQAHVNALV